MSKKTNKRNKPSSNAASQAVANQGGASAAAVSGPMPAPNSRQKTVLGFVAAALVIMFLASFVARMEAPGVRVVQQAQPEHDHGDDDAPSAQNAPTAKKKMPDAMREAMSANASNEDAASVMGAMMQKLSENPEDLETMVTLGERFVNMGAYDKAEIFLSRALVVEPSNIKILDLLGLSMFNQEKYADAAQYFQHIADIDPQNGGAHYNLGILNKHFLNNPEAAKKHFEAVLTLKDAPKDMVEKTKAELAE